MSEADEKSVRLPAGPAASRRRWSEAEKRRIVAESYQPGVSVSVVARRNDVNANLVFNWRRRFRERGGLGRKSWLFCGSDRGGVRAAAMYTLIGTAKLNDVDPQAWLADVLGRIAETPQSRLNELLPWNWVPEQKLDRAA